MRVLGPAIITQAQQRNMRDRGHKHLIIARDKVFADAAERAKVGDAWWVKEPFFDVQSPQFGCPEFHEMLIGYGPWRYEIPAHIKPYTHVARWTQKDAKGLRRGESLAYLVIAEETDIPSRNARPGGPGWLCRVHLQNIDAALKAAA